MSFWSIPYPDVRLCAALASDVTFHSRCQQIVKVNVNGAFGGKAETKKVMSQKCIENMYFRTIFLRHRKR